MHFIFFYSCLFCKFKLIKGASKVAVVVVARHQKQQCRNHVISYQINDIGFAKLNFTSLIQISALNP